MRNKRGFTLIELLVVVSIIALLVSILLPALGRAKAMATKVVCVQRQSGLGKAMMMYASDHNGEFVTYNRERPQVSYGYGQTVEWPKDSGDYQIIIANAEAYCVNGYLGGRIIKPDPCDPCSGEQAAIYALFDSPSFIDSLRCPNWNVGHGVGITATRAMSDGWCSGTAPAQFATNFEEDLDEPCAPRYAGYHMPYGTASDMAYHRANYRPFRLSQIRATRHYPWLPGEKIAYTDVLWSGDPKNQMHKNGANALFCDGSAAWVSDMKENKILATLAVGPGQIYDELRFFGSTGNHRQMIGIIQRLVERHK